MAATEDVEQRHSRVDEELQAPLIVTDKGALNGGFQGEEQLNNSDKEERWIVYLSTFVAICGSYEFGCCVGYSSPTQSAIREDLNLSIAQYSLFGSLLTFGAMIGAITSGPVADFIGRKGAMRLASAFCAAGWLAIYFAQGDLALDVGRLATGYGMGVFSYVVPIFIAELAPKDLRGALTTLNQLMICTGGSTSFIIGTVITWRTLALIDIIPCGLVLLGLPLIPESPRWLANRKRLHEFQMALRRLRGSKADITAEAAEIQDYIETLHQLPKAKVLDLFQRRYLHAVIIGLGLMAVQQFGGINGVCFYTSSIFESAGFNPDVGTISYAVLQVIITALGATLIDRVGRKPLVMVSATGLVIGCGLAGLSFYFKEQGIALGAVPVLALVGIMVYVGSFSIGMGAVPWVVMSEIFPINIKGVAASLATLVNWFGAWACSFTFNFLMSWSSYGTFGLYAAINAVGLVFVMKVVPETKGRTLEQIQAAINVVH